MLKKIFAQDKIKYLTVGFLAFVVDFGLLYVLHKVFAIPVVFATAIAFLASFAFTYTLQKTFTFQSKTKHMKSLSKYTALVGFNTIIVALTVHYLNKIGFSLLGAKIVSTCLNVFWNYFAYKYFVFKKISHIDKSESYKNV